MANAQRRKISDQGFPFCDVVRVRPGYELAAMAATCRKSMREMRAVEPIRTANLTDMQQNAPAIHAHEQGDARFIEPDICA